MQRVFTALFALFLFISGVPLSASGGIGAHFTPTNIEMEDLLNDNLDDIDIAQTSEDREVSPPVVSPPAATSVNVTARVLPNCPQGLLQIGQNAICITNTGGLGDNAGNGVRLYNGQWGNNFLYAHNYAHTFGPLVHMGVGSTFSITRNGKTTHYKIVWRTRVCDYDNKHNDGITKQRHVCSDGEPKLIPHAGRKTHSGDVVFANFLRGNYAPGGHFDFSLMTCDGRPLGAGDATHRVIAYAVRI